MNVFQYFQKITIKRKKCHERGFYKIYFSYLIMNSKIILLDTLNVHHMSTTMLNTLHEFKKKSDFFGLM